MFWLVLLYGCLIFFLVIWGIKIFMRSPKADRVIAELHEDYVPPKKDPKKIIADIEATKEDLKETIARNRKKAKEYIDESIYINDYFDGEKKEKKVKKENNRRIK